MEARMWKDLAIGLQGCGTAVFSASDYYCGMFIRIEPFQLKGGGNTMTISVFRARRLNTSSADLAFGNIAPCLRHRVSNLHVIKKRN